MFDYNKHVNTEYVIVEHNPKLFAINSHVTKENPLGNTHVFKNFVAEVQSKKEAEKIVSMLRSMDAQKN